MAAILERRDLSNSEFLCHCDATHQVLAQTNLWFGRKCRLKNFKMAAMAAILDIWTERFKQFWISMSLRCLPSFRLNLTYDLGDVIWKISRSPPWRPSWISERNDFSNYEYLCYCDASHQVSTQSNLRFVRRCLKNFNMAATWILERKDFSNSESLCHYDASHQDSAQSDLRFGTRCGLKNFKMAILVIGTERFQQFLISMLPQFLQLSFSSIQLMVLEEM